MKTSVLNKNFVNVTNVIAFDANSDVIVVINDIRAIKVMDMDIVIDMVADKADKISP